MFQVNPLLGRGFTCKIKPYFPRKIKVKKLKCRLPQFLFDALRININLKQKRTKMDLCGMPAVTGFSDEYTPFDACLINNL